MIEVRFAVQRFTTDVEELDEDILGQLLQRADDFTQWACGLAEIEGVLVIGDASVGDDLVSATQRLCFDAITALADRGMYVYRYFTSNEKLALTTSSDGVRVALAGTDVPTADLSRDELLPALYACGVRYLAFLEELGRRGRAASADDIAQLRPHQERAHAALVATGLG